MVNIAKKAYISRYIAASFAAFTLAGLSACCCDCCNDASENSENVAVQENSRFKIGVADWDAAEKNNPNGDCYEVAKSAGLQGIEISATRSGADCTIAMTPAQIANAKNRLQQTGLQCSSVCTAFTHGTTFWEDPKVYEYMCSAVDLTRELGANKILLPILGKSALNRKDVDGEMKIQGEMVPESFKAFVEKMKPIAAYAESKGVVICLEDSLSPDDNIKLIDAINSPAVKVYYDIYNVEHYGFNSLEAANKFKNGYIGQIHIKTKSGYLDKETEMPKDLNKILQTLCDSDYNGWLILEYQAKPKEMSRIQLLKYTADTLKAKCSGL